MALPSAKSLAYASLILRLSMSIRGAPSWLASRADLSSPQSSLKRAREGIALWRRGSSPYDGSVWHGPPILLVLLRAFFTLEEVAKFAYVLPFLLADALSALSLKGIVGQGRLERADTDEGSEMKRIVSSGWAMYDMQESREREEKEKEEDRASRSRMLALAYLWNPCTILTCVAGSSVSLENACILAALNAAVSRNAPLASFFVVMAAYLSLHPVLYALPVGLILARGSEALGEDDSHETMTMARRQKLKQFIVWSLSWFIALFAVSNVILWSAGHTGTSQWLVGTYGFILGAEDLSPNMGLYWYLLTEIFDEFRGIFTFTLQMGSVILLPPLFVRLSDRPLFMACVMSILIALFRPYPTYGDQALYFGLIPLFSHQLKGMKHKVFLANAFLWLDLLGPVFWYLWTRLGVANANFYYAVTLGHACVQILLLNDMISATIIHRREIKDRKKKN